MARRKLPNNPPKPPNPKKNQTPYIVSFPVHSSSLS